MDRMEEDKEGKNLDTVIETERQELDLYDVHADMEIHKSSKMVVLDHHES